MLVCSDEAANRIAGSVVGVARLLITGADWTGKRVGPYRLIREIGRGGMGIVFEASRDDAEYRKQVALKLAPSWSGQPELIERFRQERQILAALEHPNIARFLDGGTEDGVPYFVMEYVDGVSLLEWRTGRSLRESIDLFRLVCAAVHYAHENLIVHRDLKPANILVTREGVPKLLDFGIAKALQGDSGATTGFRPWTPDYASPEQVRGGAISTRSDVYSLGLILYELLCGERAQQPDLSSPLALDRSICEAESPLPSVRAAADGDTGLARQLAGDLDTIVAMAIHKDPKRRYGSAAALSSDLERYLSRRPVEARPATVWYRTGKFIRRRRLALAAAALVAATAAAGAIATVHQARRAERRFQQVRSLADTFVFDVYDRIQFLPGATAARKAIISTALRYLESLRPDAADDPSLAIELAAAYQRIGDVQGHPQQASLHDTDGAFASYAASRSLLEPLDRNGDPRAALPLAQSEFKLGLIEMARGHAPAADASFEHAHAIVRRVISGQQNHAEALKLAGDITSEMAVIAVNQRDPVRGQQAAQETVEIARRLVALQPGSVTALEYLGAAQSSLGGAYYSARQLEKAIESYRESAATREQLVARESSNTTYRRALMMSYGHIADTLGPTRYTGGIGELDGAWEAIGKAIRIAEAMVAEDSSDRTARQDLATAMYRSGDILLSQGRAGAALAEFEKSEALLAGLLSQDSDNENCRYLLFYVRRRIAEALETMGRDAEAARNLAVVRAMSPSFAHTKDAANANTMDTLATIDLARIKARAGDPTAPSLAQSAAEQAGAAPRPANSLPWNAALNDAELGRLFAQLGNRELASAWLAKAAAIFRQMKVTGALEPQRAAQLAGIEHDLAKVR